MSEQSKKLSAIIITKNEEDNIARSIRSVSFAAEVIVVDSESSDRTLEIADSLGAKTFVRPWPGYGPQKNFASQQANSDWLFFIDADEEVTQELAAEIARTISSSQKDFYWLKIVTVFLGRRMNYIYGHNLRLFKKSAGKWTDFAVHEQVETISGRQLKLGDTLSKPLQNPLLHHSHKTVASYLARMQRYSTLDAEQMAKKDHHRSGRLVKPVWWLPYYLAKRQFIKLYFYKRGFLDGYAGFMWSLLSGYYEYVMAKKYLAIKRSV